MSGVRGQIMSRVRGQGFRFVALTCFLEPEDKDHRRGWGLHPLNDMTPPPLITRLRPPERKFVPSMSDLTVPSDSTSDFLSITQCDGAEPMSVSPPLRRHFLFPLFADRRILPSSRTWPRPGRRCPVSTTTPTSPLRSRPSPERPPSSATRRCEA